MSTEHRSNKLNNSIFYALQKKLNLLSKLYKNVKLRHDKDVNGWNPVRRTTNPLGLGRM